MDTCKLYSFWVTLACFLFVSGAVYCTLPKIKFSTCQISDNGRDHETTFIFEEVPEDYPVGKLPGGFSIVPGPMGLQSESVKLNFEHGRRMEQSAACEYINASVNDVTGEIEFYLKQSLSQYHLEKFKPYIELQFTLECSDDPTPYTYMITIIDDNLHKPTFSNVSYTGRIDYTTAKGFKIHFDESPDNQKGILVSDPDFNKQNANISISCEGSHCSFFTFSPEHMGFEKGHRFYIDTFVNTSELGRFRKEVKDGDLLTFDLHANDSKYTTSTKVSLQAQLTNPVGDQPESTDSMKLIIGSISAIVVVMISCSGAVAYLVIKRRKAKDILRQLTEAEIRDFLEGTANFSVESTRTISIDVNTPIIALPYNRHFEIPRERLKIDETTILGTGAFGVVWKGLISYSNGEGITVAVKSIKRNVGVLYFKALLSELKIMAYIGKHQNIVSLTGACTHNIRKREVYIALQYCANGNFHNYLKCRRDRFSNMVYDGVLQLQTNPVSSYMYSTNGSSSKSISTLDLLSWATQIANGLQYLESKGVIHGDLATRNILLDENKVAKIGDFGLSRRLIDYSNYYDISAKGDLSKTPLPWKWMAPETLKDMKFSKKSDIWSFGMVLWEIFTLGQTPYPGLSWNPNFVESLEKGMRPWKPSYAPTKMLDIIWDCWNLDPFDRPDIFDIKRRLENMSLAALRQMGDKIYMRLADAQQYMTLGKEGEDQVETPYTEM